QILQLGRDFPRLWGAPTTAACDRKRMLRLLIRDITVVKGPEPKRLRLQIRWQGGAIETIEIYLQPNHAEAIRYPDTFIDKVRALATKNSAIRALASLDRSSRSPRRAQSTRRSTRSLISISSATSRRLRASSARRT